MTPNQPNDHSTPDDNPAHSPTKGYVLHPGEGVSSPDVKASQASTAGSITLIESQTNGGAPMHVHHHQDECFYVLEGLVTVHCGEDYFEAGPGAFAFLPRGIPHSWDVVGEGTAKLLIITVPAGLEEFLEELHKTDLSQEHRDVLAAKHGITLVR